MASMADSRRYALGNQLGEGLEVVFVWFFFIYFYSFQ